VAWIGVAGTDVVLIGVAGTDVVRTGVAGLLIAARPVESGALIVAAGRTVVAGRMVAGRIAGRAAGRFAGATAGR
jgi:hypothetical protein